MASIDDLHQESLTLKVKDHSDMLFVQYLVNCLKENHVSHGITTHPGSEIFILDLLNCSSKTRHKKERNPPQPAYTRGRFGNNIVLRDGPPPIADDEKRLNRKQRCTLSQLRSGHCYLLHDYKHICTDCWIATHTRRTWHLRIYGRIQWNQS